MIDRDWQNWDKGETAELIDHYWTTCETSWYKFLGQDIKRHLVEGSIIEVGCGSGLVYDELLMTGLRSPDPYVGGDVSAKMLEIARRRFPKGRFINMDIFHLPFTDRLQDNVICVNVLQHLPHYSRALSELLRITRRKLYIASWFNVSTEDKIGMTEYCFGQSFYGNHYSLPAFLHSLVSMAGERITELHVRHLSGWTELNYSVGVTFDDSHSNPC